MLTQKPSGKLHGAQWGRGGGRQSQMKMIIKPGQLKKEKNEIELVYLKGRKK